MSRKTFNDKILKYVQQDPLIGISNYVKTVSTVVYRGPYLDPGDSFRAGLSYCSGEIAAGLEVYVILMEQDISLEIESLVNRIEPDFAVRTDTDRALQNSNIAKKTNKMINFYKSKLSDAEQKLIEGYMSRTQDNRLSIASLFAGYVGYTHSYRIPKRMFGAHKLDYTAKPSPDIILDIRMGRDSKRSVENITIRDIQYNNYNDLRNTGISVSGVSSQIKNADVSNNNTLSMNLRNGVESILQDDCEKRTIDLHRNWSQPGRNR